MYRFVHLFHCTILLQLSTFAIAEPPAIPREFRAAWIATVANIDWPSRPGLPVDEMKKELIALLDLASETNMNAVVFQVRPAADAIYNSELEPWSEYLTGTMGIAPADNFDPLEFAVTEAHRRGLELHAWFNPYRAAHTARKSPISEDHISRTQPELVKEYGAYLWLDPGDQQAAAHSKQVIMDVVDRYDIDGVHFDDYFYPYPINDSDGKEIDFPDEPSWQAYLARTPKAEQLSRHDFRRNNVNEFVRYISESVHQRKPWVKFGISPFGIYRPGHPESIKGFDAYSKLYADSRLWFQEGYVDYMSPQLYWPIDQEPQSFKTLLSWWQEQNAHDRHLWPGMYTSKVEANNKGLAPSELVDEIELVRSQVEGPGHIHFSIKAIAQNRSGLRDILQTQVYFKPALVPATEWLSLGEEPNTAAEADVEGFGVRTKLNLKATSEPWLWTVQHRTTGDWLTNIHPGSTKVVDLTSTPATQDDIVVQAVDRLGRVSPVKVNLAAPAP
jgi:uncharacterized lipoprotein YddW (UPF0748 family)